MRTPAKSWVTATMLVLSLSSTVHAYYNPRLGRWMSRDPIGEGDGPGIYMFVANRPVNAWDRLGLEWKILRQSHYNWAVASATDKSDTFQTLADKLRLDYGERMKWLRRGDRFVGEADNASVGCRYGVPNTVVVYTTPNDVSYAANALRDWAVHDALAYKHKNYHLMLATDKSSQSTFVSLWQQDGIYAFFFGGHGAEKKWFSGIWMGYVVSGFGMFGTAVAPDEVRPPYGLQSIGAYFCGSADPVQALTKENPISGPAPTSKWSDYLSNKGSFRGYSGSAFLLSTPKEINAPIGPPPQ